MALPGLPAPQDGTGYGNLPGLPAPVAMTPEQADIQDFQASANPLQQGLRAGFNRLSGQMHALIGQTGETLGLSDFAKQHLDDAEHDMWVADQTDSPVKDIGQVRDATQLSKFVAGMIGNAAAQVAPMAVGGLALRGPAAIAAGVAPFSAGEQVMKLRANPEVMKNHTPGDILANAGMKGAADSVLYSTVGAPGHFARDVGGKMAERATGSLKGALAEGALGQGAAAGGSVLAGQKLEQQLDPNKQMDFHEALNEAVANAIPGAIISGAGHAIGKIPGGVARTAEDLKQRLGKKEYPADINSEPSLDEINPNMTAEDVAKMLGGKFDGAMSGLDAVWNHIKDHPKAQQFKDYATDPDVRQEFNDAIQKKVRDVTQAPLVQGVKQFVQGLPDQIKAYKESRGEPEVKKSEMPTAMDDDIHAAVVGAMPTEFQAAMDEHPTEMLALSDAVKQLAANPEYFANTSFPRILSKVYGNKFEPLMNTVVERMYSPGPARTAAKKAIKEGFRQENNAHDTALEEVQSVIRQHLRPEYLAKPEMRKTALEQFAPQLMKYVMHEGENPGGEAGFKGQVHEAFGDQADKAMEKLDAIRKKQITSTRAYESNAKESVKLSDEEHEQETKDIDHGDETDPHAGNQPHADPRMNQVFPGTPEGSAAADKLRDELTAEYGRKNVTINKHVDQETGEISLSLESADHMGLTRQEFRRSRVDASYGEYEMKDGALTVRTDSHPQGEKISVPNLTKEMMRREGGQLPEDKTKYVAEMVKRGIAALMGSDEFRGFKKDLPTDAEGRITFPDDMKVAVLKGGESYTWGDIKEAGKLSKWDVGGFTKEEMIDRMNQIEAHREARGWKPLPDKVLRKQAVVEIRDELKRRDPGQRDRMDRQMEKSGFETRQLDSDPQTLENTKSDDFKPMYRGKYERDELMEGADTGKFRDQLDKKGEPIPRAWDEDNGRPIGEVRAPGAFESKRLESPEMRKAPIGTERPVKQPGDTKHGEVTAVKEMGKAAPLAGIDKSVVAEPSIDMPHGKGPKSLKGMKAADATTAVQTALNSANPKVAETAKQLTKGWDTKKSGEEYDKLLKKTKFSTMNIKDGPQTEEMRQAVRDHVEKVLGKDQTNVLFEKMAHAGEFSKLGPEESIKISVDSSDPMSVAYHESVHALMSRLRASDPKAAHTLMQAANAAPMIARLRELLKDYPAALKQLSDPEERLAYMYQFSATGKKGLLSIGPNTRTLFEKITHFFNKVRAVWADDMTSAMAVEKTNDILTAFHNGELSDRNTVAQVLKDRFPPDPDENLRKVWPGLGRFMDKFVWTSQGAVRSFKNEHMDNIMDKFFVQTGATGHTPGFNQVKHVVNSQYMNRIMDVLNPLDEAASEKLRLEMMSDKRDSKEAKALEGVLKELFDYQVQKGVKTYAGKDEKGNVQYEDLKRLANNYWPRMYDLAHLRTAEGKEGFLNLLAKHGIVGTEGEKIHMNVSRDLDSGNPAEGDVALGLTYYTPHLNERKLQDIPDAELAPYLNKSVFGTMSQYVSRAVRRAEYTERFGNRGEIINEARAKAEQAGATAEQLRTFDDSVQAQEGTLGADMNPKLKNVYGAIMTYENVRLLPLQLFSSFVDPLGITVRGGTLGDAFNGFTRGIRELFGSNKDDAYMMAKTVGTINSTLDARLMAEMASAQYMPKIQRQINAFFFKYNGMESWNMSQRIAATAAAHDFLVRHVTKPTEHSERYLAELGLKKDDVKVTDGKLDLKDQKVALAMNRWVDEAILRPSSSQRPIYMSDPHYMLISHLKQYSYLFQKSILARVNNEISHGNYTPAMALAGYVPAMIAADVMRMMVTPGSADNDARAAWGLKDWLWSGVQRAGIFGPGQFLLGSGTDAGHGKIPGQSLAGPAGEQLINFISASARGTGVGNELVNAVPFYKLFKGGGQPPIGGED